MNTIKVTFFDEELTLSFEKSNYLNGNIYVGIINAENGEPWADLTVNLGIKLARSYAYLDSNSPSYFQSLIKTLEKLGLIIDTHETAQSGFCIYPLYELTDKFLNEWCREIV